MQITNAATTTPQSLQDLLSPAQREQVTEFSSGLKIGVTIQNRSGGNIWVSSYGERTTSQDGMLIPDSETYSTLVTSYLDVYIDAASSTTDVFIDRQKYI